MEVVQATEKSEQGPAASGVLNQPTLTGKYNVTVSVSTHRK